MKKFLICMLLLSALGGCLQPPPEPEDTAPEPVPLSVPLATG